MANQIQATVYLVDNTLQAEPFAMSFFTSNISIRSGSSSLSGSVNSVIQYYYSLTNPSEYKEYYVSEIIDTLVAAAGNTQVQCTVLNINGTSQVSGGVEFSFPSEQISIFPSTGLFTDVNAYILFKGNKFYTDDTVDTLKATANVGDYKVYTALLTQTNSSATSGLLIVGHEYLIVELNAGDDFANVGYISDGTPFTATGTTPTDWTNSTEVLDNTLSAPVATILQNTLGGDVLLDKDTNIISGAYNATLPNIVLGSKIYASITKNSVGNNFSINIPTLEDVSTLQIFSMAGNTLTDNLLNITPVEILVYP